MADLVVKVTGSITATKTHSSHGGIFGGDGTDTWRPPKGKKLTEANFKLISTDDADAYLDTSTSTAAKVKWWVNPFGKVKYRITLKYK